MAEMGLLLKALDSAVWEMGEAFKGLPGDAVWVRAHPALWSVGELAAHVAYWEARSFFGEAFETPLGSPEVGYYSHEGSVPMVMDWTAPQVYAEVVRVHQAAKEYFQASSFDSEDLNPNRKGATWGWTLEYQAFHVAYHTGQMYSVRHLLGHVTEDN